MEKHLGRNPFEKARDGSNKSRPTFIEPDKTSPVEWLFIQLPAKAFMFALKTGILVKSVLDKKR
ncbi:MAG: hypothetical protein ABIQ95_14235 [Bdellovibrionia bacterium]